MYKGDTHVRGFFWQYSTSLNRIRVGIDQSTNRDEPVCRNKREPCQQKLSTFLNDFQDFGGKVSAINRIHNKDVVA